MNEQAVSDLFDAMDQIANELRDDPLWVVEDEQIAFRQLQKERMPDLTKEQFMDMFEQRQQRALDQLRPSWRRSAPGSPS
jgi:hypothetical protein